MKKRNEEPTFKGYDDQGEPVFAWPPEVPAWMRAEYVRQWKWDQPRRAPVESSTDGKGGGA